MRAVKSDEKRATISLKRSKNHHKHCHSMKLSLTLPKRHCLLCSSEYRSIVKRTKIGTWVIRLQQIFLKKCSIENREALAPKSGCIRLRELIA